MSDQAQDLREFVAVVTPHENHAPKIDYEQLWKSFKEENRRKAQERYLYDIHEGENLGVEDGDWVSARIVDRMEQAEILAMTREIRI